MIINPGAKALKKNFTLEEKYQIILHYENKSQRVKDLQAKFGCGKTQIYRMIKFRDEIKQEYLSGKKNPKTKRSVKYTPNNATNRAVLKWYEETRRRGEKVNGTVIKAKAREIGELLGLTDFKASNGWLQSFQYRNNISLSVNSNNKTKVSEFFAGTSAASSPVQPIKDPLHTDGEDILSEVDEIIQDNKHFEKLENVILKEKPSEYDSTDLCTVCETVLYYNTLPDDADDEHTDQLTILFCYYNDGNYEKPLITLNETHLGMIRKQFFNNFVIKSNATGLLTFQYLVEYLTILNSKLLTDNRYIILRLDKKFEMFSFGNLSNMELVFEPLNNGANGDSMITTFKLQYRNLLLNSYIPFACNSTKKLTFTKHFDLNDAIKLILKSLGNMDFSTNHGDDGGSSDLRSQLYDKMVICKCCNLNTENYLNVDAYIVYHDGTLHEDGDSDDEDKIISLSKATIYLIEIKKMLMLRGDERLIDKVDELQSDLNEMCFEEKRLDLI